MRSSPPIARASARRRSSSATGLTTTVSVSSFISLASLSRNQPVVWLFCEFLDQPLAQRALLDLRRRHRPLADEAHMAGDLEARDPLAAEADQLVLARAGPGAELDEHSGDLLQARVGHPDRLNELDRGVRRE